MSVTTLPAASVKNFDAVPLPFTQSEQGFHAHGKGVAIELTKSGAFVAVEKGTLAFRVVGAKPDVSPTPLNPLPGVANFLIGNEPTKWRRNVPTYGKVAYRGVLPGVDLIYYGNEKRLEYDFEVAPGVDPKSIEVEIGAAWKASIAKDGSLVLRTEGGGRVDFAKPVTYQVAANGERMAVESQYALRDRNRFGFKVGKFDKSRPLVIDPMLVWGTYLGGSSAETGNSIAVDAAGNVYVTGWTTSNNFPTTNSAFLTTCNPTSTNNGVCNSPNSDNSITTGVTYAYVTKFNPEGTQVIYSTYLGGTLTDTIGGNQCCGSFGSFGQGIAIDAAGNAYIAGYTHSRNFPVTGNAAQGVKQQILRTTWPGTCAPPTLAPSDPFTPDAFVTKLDSTGSNLVYSTYLGGSLNDVATGIAVNSAGEMFVVGQTLSSTNYSYNFTGCSFDAGKYQNFGFPTTANALYPEAPDQNDTHARGFFTKLSAAGAIAYSTYIGANYNYTLVDNTSRISPSPDILPSKVAVDGSGMAYIVGSTRDPRFGNPSCNGCGIGSTITNVYDAFVMKLDTNGGSAFTRVFGGLGVDVGNAVALDTAGNVYVAGTTYNGNSPTQNVFPTTSGSYMPNRPLNSSNSYDDCGFLRKYDFSGTLQFSTLFCNPQFGATTANGLAVDPASGSAAITGISAHSGFPQVNGIAGGAPGGTGAYLARFNPAGTALDFSSFIAVSSGQNDDQGYGNAVVLDSSLNAYVTGSAGNPLGTMVTPGAFRTTYSGPEAFVAKVSTAVAAPTTTAAANASLSYSPNSQNVTVSATVTSPGGIVNTGAVSFTLLGVTLAGNVVNGSASASFSVPATTAAGSYPITASYGATPIFLASSDTTKSLTINKATPVISWSNPANIVSGTALGATQLNATANVPGGFAYNPTAGTVLPVGNNQTLSVSFTPTDTTNYTTASASVLINVTAPVAAATTTTAANAQVTYSPNAQNVQLSATVTSTGGTVNAGTLSFSLFGSTLNANVVNGVASVSFPIPAGKAAGPYAIGAAYNGVSTFAASSDNSKQLTIAKATPVVSWANPASITAGTALGATQLNASANVPGSFVYNPPAGTVLPVGNNQTLAVTFTPTDVANYTTATATVSISVTAGLGVQVAPLSLQFSPQIVGTSSGGQDVTITNTGGGALAITSITSNGDFSRTSNCPASLAVNASCVVNVKFTPTGTGTRTGSLVVVDGAGTQTVSLSGSGIDGAARINVSVAASGPQSAGVTYADLKFTNAGTGPANDVQVSQLFVTGLGPAKLNTGTPLPLVIGSLAPGVSKTVRILIDTNSKQLLVVEYGQFTNASGVSQKFSSLQTIGFQLF